MTPFAVSRTLATARLALPFMVPALLGFALLGVIGFAPYPAAHDAMHDIRHAAGFPCH